MKFRNIILLSISGIVFGLLLASYLVVNYWTSQQVESRTAGNLRSQYSTLRELNALRLEELAKSCQIIAETPRLKAVAELGDKNTIGQLAEELQQSTRADLFMLTNARNEPLVQLVHGMPRAFSLGGLPALRPPGHAVATDVWNLDSMSLRLASAPLIVGPDTVGTVTIGVEIGAAEMLTLRSMTGSDILLVPSSAGGDSPLPLSLRREILEQVGGAAGTLPPADSAVIAVIPTSGDTYEGTRLRLGSGAASPGDPEQASMVILISVSREIRAALEPVRNAFLILSVAVLLMTLGIGYLIARSITRPIAELVRGTSEVGKGNYDVRIDVPSGVELKFLAQNFQSMSASLKEKIQQLADRNQDLEEALRKLRETQQELMKSERLAATGRLTAQLSHEINNPVHNILSSLQTVLKRTVANAPERELLEVAYEEVERLARLTQQLLQVYRTSMAVQEPTVPVCMNDIIRDVASSYAETLGQNRIRVATSLRDPLPAVQAAPDKLKQVFVNLILNARDAMPQGGTISIATSIQNGSVLTTVADTGVGIPPENIHRIFDAFFTTKSKVSGVGLGLSVTYGIVQQYNGAIAVKSSAGGGTTFTITFPATSAALL
jgi:signal transduction histidine kinase